MGSPGGIKGAGAEGGKIQIRRFGADVPWHVPTGCQQIIKAEGSGREKIKKIRGPEGARIFLFTGDWGLADVDFGGLVALAADVDAGGEGLGGHAYALEVVELNGSVLDSYAFNTGGDVAGEAEVNIVR